MSESDYIEQENKIMIQCLRIACRRIAKLSGRPLEEIEQEIVEQAEWNFNRAVRFHEKNLKPGE